MDVLSSFISRFEKGIDLETVCYKKEISIDDVYDKYCDVIMWNTQVTPPGDHHVQTNAPGKNLINTVNQALPTS